MDLRYGIQFPQTLQLVLHSPGNQLDIQRSIALAAALVHAVVFYMSLSNVMSPLVLQ
jgi:hypothetical protein